MTITQILRFLYILVDLAYCVAPPAPTGLRCCWGAAYATAFTSFSKVPLSKKKAVKCIKIRNAFMEDYILHTVIFHITILADSSSK